MSVCVQIHEGHADGLLELRLGFDPVAVRVLFAWTKWRWGSFYSKYFGFHVISFYQCSKLIDSSIIDDIYQK
jgi:hypothetical protein